MGKRPSIQWYTGDWLKDPAVRSVSFAARGLWIDMICLMCECDRKGYLILHGKPVTPALLARMTGGAPDEVSHLLSELETSGVFSRTDLDVIYSRRITRDERIRRKRAAGGVLGGNPVLLNKVNLTDNLDHNLLAEDEDEDEVKEKPLPEKKRSAEKLCAESFGLFWEQYPKKVARAAAFREWRRLKPSPELCETVMAALAKQKYWPQWTKDGGQFIPNASTWLHGHRWEDSEAVETARRKPLELDPSRVRE